MGKVHRTFSKRGVLVTVGGALALAAVIFIASSLGTPAKKSSGPSAAVTPAVEAQLLAGKAQTALANGQTDSAVDLANQALALDKSNQAAAQVIEDATPVTDEDVSQQPQEPDGSAADAAPEPRDDAAYRQAVEQLPSLLPASIDGWIAGQLLEQGDTAIVTFEPKPGTDAYRQVVRATVTVHDMRTTSEASAFVSRVDARLYSHDKTTVKVGVIPDAYFGTDGSAIATVAFARGRYSFEISVSTPSNVDPKDVRALLANVATALPAAK